jgi:hypothetical protein
MLRSVAHVRTDVSEESVAYIIMMTRIGELGTTLAVISNQSKVRRNTMGDSPYVSMSRLPIEEAVRFKVSTAVTMKNSVFWSRVALVRTDVSEEHIAPIIRVTGIGVLRLLVIGNVVHSWPFLVTLMMEVMRSSKTSVLTVATWRNIPKDGILRSHRRGNLKSYIALSGWAL